jgi:hypothetical protein
MHPWKNVFEKSEEKLESIGYQTLTLKNKNKNCERNS